MYIWVASAGCRSCYVLFWKKAWSPSNRLSLPRGNICLLFLSSPFWHTKLKRMITYLKLPILKVDFHLSRPHLCPHRAQVWTEMRPQVLWTAVGWAWRNVVWMRIAAYLTSKDVVSQTENVVPENLPVSPWPIQYMTVIPIRTKIDVVITCAANWTQIKSVSLPAYAPPVPLVDLPICQPVLLKLTRSAHSLSTWRTVVRIWIVAKWKTISVLGTVNVPLAWPLDPSLDNNEAYAAEFPSESVKIKHCADGIKTKKSASNESKTNERFSRYMQDQEKLNKPRKMKSHILKC